MTHAAGIKYSGERGEKWNPNGSVSYDCRSSPPMSFTHSHTLSNVANSHPQPSLMRSVLLYLALQTTSCPHPWYLHWKLISFLSHRSNIATQRRGLQGTAESLGKFKYVGEFKNGKFSGKVRSRLVT